MTLADWLFGPKFVDGGAAGRVLGSSYTVSISAVLAIGDELKRVYPTVRFFRGIAPVSGQSNPVEVPVDPTELSDPDLGALFIHAYAEKDPGPAAKPNMSIRVGGMVATRVEQVVPAPAEGAAADLGELRERVEELLTQGRRRLPAWRAWQLARLGGRLTLVALLAVLVNGLLVEQRDPLLFAVALLAFLAFAWQVAGRLDALVMRRHMQFVTQKVGRVRIDATDYTGLRNKRANRHRDFWVAAIAFCSGVALTVLAWALAKV